MKTNLEIKKLQEALIYTKEAIGRLLGFTAKSILRVMVWWSGFWILVKGRRPRLYKKGPFREHFAQFRQNSARTLTVSSYIPGATSEFFIKNEAEGTVNYVGYSRDVNNKPRYECGCGDFKAMQPAFKAPACKHIYAVLMYQGFDSMAAAILKHKEEFAARSALGF